jgi:hypothetical protein
LALIRLQPKVGKLPPFIKTALASDYSFKLPFLFLTFQL